RPLTRCWAAVVPDSGCRKLSSSTWRAMAAMPLTASFVSRLVVRIQEEKDRRVVVFASSAVGSCVSETVIVFLLLPGCFRQTDGVVASATTRLLLGGDVVGYAAGAGAGTRVASMRSAGSPCARRGSH